MSRQWQSARLYFQKNAQRKALEEVSSALNAGYKSVLVDLQQTVIPACESASEEWAEYCNAVKLIHENGAVLEDKRLHAVSRKLSLDLLGPSYKQWPTETYNRFRELAEGNAIQRVLRAFNQAYVKPMLGWPNSVEALPFSKNVIVKQQLPDFEVLDQVIDFANFSNPVTIQMTMSGPDGQTKTKTITLGEEVVIFINFTRKLKKIWNLQAREFALNQRAKQSILARLQILALLLTCFIFPFRVGKSIYEILEVKKSPQQEQLRAKRRGGLSLVRKVSRYRSSRW
ncbi:MAG: hypothetical protein ACFHHU_00425 [Porticoccaceae bacterium]